MGFRCRLWRANIFARVGAEVGFREPMHLGMECQALPER